MAQQSRSAFDFSDQYGTDPVMRRYRPVDFMDIREAESAVRSSAASRELAEANLAAAQAELNARLAPMKMASETIKSMSDMLKTKTAIEEEAAIQRSAAAIADGLGKAGDLDSVIALGNANFIGLRDGVIGPQWRVSALNGFKQAVDNAQSVAEVETAYAKLPSSVAFEPEFKGSYDNAKAQAERREGVRKAYASEPALGVVPTTPGGQVDVTAAGLAIAAKAGEKERATQAINFADTLQDRIKSLRAKIKEDLDSKAGVDQNDIDEIRDLEKAASKAVAAAGTFYQPAVSQITDKEVVQGGNSTVLPPEAVRTTAGAPAAAAASSAATGGGTAPAPTPVAVPTPAITLDQEALQAAEAAAPKRTAPGAGRAAKATEAKRKRDEANRIQLLKDERSKLQSAIYQKQGRGGGGRVTTRLKPGLEPGNEVVQKTLARINEITAEIGE